MVSKSSSKIYFVDDDAAVRDAMRMFMTATGRDIEVFDSGEAFLDAYQSDWSGCVLLDINMPGMSGLAVQKELQTRGCTMPVIFVTGHGDVPMAVGAMHKGAFDFIPKPYSDDELLACITRAMEQHQTVVEKIRYRQCIKENADKLTPRERQILRYVASGAANKVIATDLGLSQRTVEVHRAHVMEKMSARSLADLIRMALELDDNVA